VCNNPDKKYLKAIRDDYRETVHLLSREMKSERECMVCRAFLRCAGIPFTKESIKVSRDEPPDVLFDSARFEVMIILDEDRRMDREWKEKVQRVENAQCSEDLWLPPPSPKFIRLAQLIPLVTEKLKVKFERYGKRGISCGDLDALVYLNLLETYVVPTSPTPGVITEEVDTENLNVQGWRSVSILMTFSPSENPDFQGWPCHHACVLTTTSTAPRFIRELVHQIVNKCPNHDKLFEP
jgi:hypothetical protein